MLDGQNPFDFSSPPSLILNNSFDSSSDSNIEVRDKVSWETKAYHDNERQS